MMLEKFVHLIPFDLLLLKQTHTQSMREGVKVSQTWSSRMSLSTTWKCLQVHKYTYVLCLHSTLILQNPVLSTNGYCVRSL